MAAPGHGGKAGGNVGARAVPGAYHLDHFKAFNDTPGHDAADTFLRELARLLERHFRGGDIACRYGGDEFVVLLTGATLEESTRRAHDLQEAVHLMQLRHFGRTLPPTTLTMGVAAYPEDGGDIASLARAADDALLRGKRMGRDRVEPTADVDLTEKHAPITPIAGPEARAAQPPSAPDPPPPAGRP